MIYFICTCVHGVSGKLGHLQLIWSGHFSSNFSCFPASHTLLPNITQHHMQRTIHTIPISCLLLFLKRNPWKHCLFYVCEVSCNKKKVSRVTEARFFLPVLCVHSPTVILHNWRSLTLFFLIPLHSDLTLIGKSPTQLHKCRDSPTCFRRPPKSVMRKRRQWKGKIEEEGEKFSVSKQALKFDDVLLLHMIRADALLPNSLARTTIRKKHTEELFGSCSFIKFDAFADHFIFMNY